MQEHGNTSVALSIASKLGTILLAWCNFWLGIVEYRHCCIFRLYTLWTPDSKNNASKHVSVISVKLFHIKSQRRTAQRLQKLTENGKRANSVCYHYIIILASKERIFYMCSYAAYQSVFDPWNRRLNFRLCDFIYCFLRLLWHWELITSAQKQR